MPHAVQYETLGGPEVLEYREVARPELGADEVRIEVRAAGVNPIDWKLRSGIRETAPFDGPRGTGGDAAGVIIEVGADVADWSVDDEVIVWGVTGAYATEAVAASAHVAAKPHSVTWEQAASLPIPVGTAYQALVSLGVRNESTLLIHGGSGAVGQAAIQFARRIGATVIATGSPKNHERMRALGAIPVAYGDGLLDRVRDAAPDGVDYALDCAGTVEAISASFELVGDPKRIGTIVIGARAAELGILAWGGGSFAPMTDDEIALRNETVGLTAELIASGEFDVEIASVRPLAEAAAAQRVSEKGELRGKIVLVP